MLRHEMNLRIRYSETDQMGTFYNSRALEWFECARTETLRAGGVSYAQMEERGVLLPLVEAHLQYLGRARYDDLLCLRCAAQFSGKARLRFDISINQAKDNKVIVEGYTVHAITDAAGKPMRPPEWLSQEIGL